MLMMLPAVIRLFSPLSLMITPHYEIVFAMMLLRCCHYAFAPPFSLILRHAAELPPPHFRHYAAAFAMPCH